MESTLGAPPVEPFEVHLDNFSGPFDLLLGLIAKHSLDITEVALSHVTDEFLEYLRRHADSWSLEVASDFLVVGATLLDLKAARLLPRGEVEDDADVAALEERDLLFVRLLQYRTFQQAGARLAERLAEQRQWFTRDVGLPPEWAPALPEVVLDLDAGAFATLAAAALTPRPTPVVSVQHLHAPMVSVPEETLHLVRALRGSVGRQGGVTFDELVVDAPTRAHVVARFLGLLELYRAGHVSLQQEQQLGELVVHWTGPPHGPVRLPDGREQ